MEEQRGLIGTLKGLGYSGGAILDGLIERVTSNIRLKREVETWDGVERRKRER